MGSNPISDFQIILLLAQVVVAVATLIGSFVIAKRWGEISASKFALREERRRDHVNQLVGEPLNNLLELLKDIGTGDFLRIGEENGELAILDHERGVNAEKRSAKIDFQNPYYAARDKLLDHLRTGHEEVYDSIQDYATKYNQIIDDTIQVYKRTKSKLQTSLKDSPLNKSAAYRVQINYNWAIQYFSEEMYALILRSRTPSKATLNDLGEGSISQVRLNEVYVSSGSIKDLKEVVDAINSLYEDVKTTNELRDLWSRATTLQATKNQIAKELDLLQSDGQAGVWIGGSCQAGINAGYENIEGKIVSVKTASHQKPSDGNRGKLDRDSIMIGVILGFLAQGAYDILKSDFAYFYPVISSEWDDLLAAISLLLLFLFAWKIPIAIHETQQHRPVFSGTWKRLFIVSIIVLVTAVILGKYDTSSIYVAVVVLIFGTVGLMLAVMSFMQITKQD